MPIKDREKRLAYKREYNKIYNARPENKLRAQRPDVKKRKREYQQRPEVKEKRREYRQRPEVKEKRAKYRKQYHQRPEVKEKRAKYRKQYYQRPHVKQRKYNQLKNNPVYKRRKYLRSIVRLAVIKQKKVSAKACNDLLGCTAQQARDHLEQQFEPWMNWDNYGRGKKKWCIDHVVSVASIDIFDEKEVKRIFHYTNMQPLGFIKNSEKGHRA